MKHEITRSLLLGQLCLFFFLLICFLLIPHFLLEQNEGGVSNYGLYARTIIPYTLGFGLCGLFTISAARRIPNKPSAYLWLKRLLTLLGAMYIAALVSTYGYKVNRVLDDAHIYASFALVATQLVLGAWFAASLVPGGVNYILAAIQYIGFVLVALNYFGLIHTLFLAELLTSLAFGVLLVRTTSLLFTQSR